MSEQKMSALDIIRNYNGPKIRIMEVCGTHTHEIYRLGIRQVLSESIELISGPGCPVCVTPVGYIDMAIDLALNHGCTICTYGDLLRVPGTEKSLSKARSEGAKVKIVYTATDAVIFAKENPSEQVVFLSVGFETTTPASVLSVAKAKELGLTNYSILTANKTMPNALQTLKRSADSFLYPGHVCAITGTKAYKNLAETDHVSGVVCGFTAKELLTSIAIIVKKCGEKEPFFVNAYPRVVKEEGNPAARRLVDEYMEACDSHWRGLGIIPMSGMKLKEKYAAYDAAVKYGIPITEGRPNPLCRCGDVLQGKCSPSDCKVFGKGCTPLNPVGACMVSNEGACSAFYQYGMDAGFGANDLDIEK